MVQAGLALIELITIALRSVRRHQSVGSAMDEQTEEQAVAEAESQEELSQADVSEETDEHEMTEDTQEPGADTVKCKKCLDENDLEPNKVHFNEKVETREVETEYSKPSRSNYLKGFAKRVVLCTIFVMIVKNAYPELQARFWPEAPAKEGKLYVLNDKSFRGHVSRGDHFVMMYAPWCGHCKRLKPDWERLARQPGVVGLSISKVDCTVSTKICGEHNVQGYPTLLYFRFVHQVRGKLIIGGLQERKEDRHLQWSKNIGWPEGVCENYER